MRMCHGEYDHLLSSGAALKRRERCAGICGNRRHLHSLSVWPDPNYRRPSQLVVAALESKSNYD